MMSDWMGMASFALLHWLLFAAAVSIFVYPLGKILVRMGFSPFLAILALIPGVNLLGLWLVALVDWPKQPGSKA